MRIRVHYLGQLKLAARRPSEDIEGGDPCSVTDFIGQLSHSHGPALARFLLDEKGQVRPSLLLFVGEEQVQLPAAVQLQDGDEVTLVSPMAGG